MSRGRRRIGTLPAGIAAVLLTAAAFASGGPGTRWFSIDGMRYSLSTSPESVSSQLRRELSKQGIDLPADPMGDEPLSGILSHGLSPEGRDDSRRPLPIPPSFSIEHALRLGGPYGESEVAFGTTGHPMRTSLRLLEERGWSRLAPPERSQETATASYSRGKEKLLAFLEAEGGGFLLVRQMER